MISPQGSMGLTELSWMIFHWGVGHWRLNWIKHPRWLLHLHVWHLCVLPLGLCLQGKCGVCPSPRPLWASLSSEGYWISYTAASSKDHRSESCRSFLRLSPRAITAPIPLHSIGYSKSQCQLQCGRGLCKDMKTWRCTLLGAIFGDRH